MNWFCLKACTKCGGDLAVDDGDWICLQCGTYYYTGLYQRGWVSAPSRPIRGSGDTGHRDDVGSRRIFGHLKGSNQEMGHLLGTV